MFRNKWISFLLGVLSTLIVISGINFFTSYERNLSRMLRTIIVYKDVSVSSELSADAYSYLAIAKRTLYFGKLPENVDAIEINSPERAILYIYPKDEDSMIVEYKPHGGIGRRYLLSDLGGFNRYLEVLYELTENEVFNETISYVN